MSEVKGVIERIENLPRAATGLVWVNQRGVLHKNARLNELSVVNLKSLVSELKEAQDKVEKYEKMLSRAYLIHLAMGRHEDDKEFDLVRNIDRAGFNWSIRNRPERYDTPLEAFAALDD